MSEAWKRKEGKSPTGGLNANALSKWKCRSSRKAKR